MIEATEGGTGTDVADALEEIPFGRMGGEEITLAWALRLLKLDLWSEPFPPQEWPRFVLEWVAVEQAAAELGLEASDEQLQEMLRVFREERKLYSAADTHRFLAARGCSVEDLMEALDLRWRRNALHHRFAGEPAERYFLQHSPEYDSAILSELVVPDESLARELALQIREEEADFVRLVRQHSTSVSRGTAGHLGEVRRGALKAREAAAVVAAPPDEVVGPFPLGREFRLLRVHEVRQAVFTEAVRREIEALLWREWLDRRIRASQPEVTILPHL